MRLVDLGDGHAAVTIAGGRLHVADVTYGTEPTQITWTRDGCMEIEQYKRDGWGTWIYSSIARWRRT